jgi:hypothetical protein
MALGRRRADQVTLWQAQRDSIANVNVIVVTTMQKACQFIDGSNGMLPSDANQFSTAI